MSSVFNENKIGYFVGYFWKCVIVIVFFLYVILDSFFAHFFLSLLLKNIKFFVNLQPCTICIGMVLKNIQTSNKCFVDLQLLQFHQNKMAE